MVSTTGGGSFVDDLELSVRTRNVLKLAGIDSREALEGLTREAVLAMKNAGRKTWYEIECIQQYLRGPTMEQREREVVQALAGVSRMMAAYLPSDTHRLILVGPREIRLVRLV